MNKYTVFTGHRISDYPNKTKSMKEINIHHEIVKIVIKIPHKNYGAEYAEINKPIEVHHLMLCLLLGKTNNYNE